MRRKLWLPEEDVHTCRQQDLHAVGGPEEVYLFLHIGEERHGALVQIGVDHVVFHAHLQMATELRGGGRKKGEGDRGRGLARGGAANMLTSFD